jgi:hypothetical protein
MTPNTNPELCAVCGQHVGIAATIEDAEIGWVCINCLPQLDEDAPPESGKIVKIDVEPYYHVCDSCDAEAPGNQYSVPAGWATLTIAYEGSIRTAEFCDECVGDTRSNPYAGPDGTALLDCVIDMFENEVDSNESH